MLCCAALIFVLGLVREVWFLLPGTTRPPEVGFAPVARRPPPGTSRPEPVQKLPAPRPGRLSAFLVLLAVATPLYAITVYLLLLLGLADGRDTRLVVWLLRDVLLAACTLAAAVGASRLKPVTPAPTPREVQGSALAGVGTAWWALGLLDMHALGLLHIRGGLAGDLAFHGAGAAMLLAGAVRCVRGAPRLATPPSTGTPDTTEEVTYV